MKQSVTDYFLSLVKIDSESKNELKIARKLKEDLEKLGAEVRFDQSHEKTGSNTGNLYAYIKGSDDLEPVLLSAHLDTVVPGNKVKPDIKEGVIRTDGTTVLGADDKSGIAQIICGVQQLLESGEPHPSIEILFTTCEEVGLLGIQNADLSLIKSKRGLVLDTHDIGTLLIGAPSQNNLFIHVMGKKAHAGADPEKGLNSILIASEAVTKVPMGRIDEETTANVGIVKGGEATNIVPDKVFLKAEVRSHSEEKLQQVTSEICKTFEDTAAKYRLGDITASAEIKVSKNYSTFYVDVSEELVEICKQASCDLGMKPSTYKGGGGSDANILNEKGIQTIVLGTGMNDVHTTAENIKVDDLEIGAKWIELILKIMGKR